MIVYGVITEESIGSLFLAGIGPGLVLIGLFVGFSILYAWLGPDYTPHASAPDGTSAAAPASARCPPSRWPALIVGGLYAGAFTPTEAAAVGFGGALILTGPVLRTMTWEKLREAVMDSMKTTVTILLILAGAKIFGKAITLYRIPQDISSAIVATFDTAGPVPAGGGRGAAGDGAGAGGAQHAADHGAGALPLARGARHRSRSGSASSSSSSSNAP